MGVVICGRLKVGGAFIELFGVVWFEVFFKFWSFQSDLSRVSETVK